MSGSRRSKRAPYQHGEPWHERHDRRKRTAIDDEQRMRNQLDSRPTEISITNDGAHWQITRDGLRFEWWPESGRFVFDQRWDQALKAHDVDQAVAWIKKKTARHGRRR